jgi:hypothetical protein
MLLFSSHYADLFMNVSRYRGICPNYDAAQSHVRQQLPTGSYFTGFLLSNLFMKTSVARPNLLCSAIRFERIYIRLSWNGPECTVPDTGCGCVVCGCESSRRRQGRTARAQARDDWGTAHRHWGKITIRIRSLLEDFARINDRELSTLSPCRIYKLLQMLRIESGNIPQTRLVVVACIR